MAEKTVFYMFSCRPDRRFARETGNFRSIGNKSHLPQHNNMKMRLLAVTILVALGFPATSIAAEPGARSLDQQRLQRQQQQEALQLRMQQQDNAARSRSMDKRQRQAAEDSSARQRQRQESSHYRQSVAPPAAQPSDDDGTRQAKEMIRRQAAGRESHGEPPQGGREPANWK